MKRTKRGQTPTSSYYQGINAPYENENLTAVGDKVVIKKHEKIHERNFGGIVIPNTLENVATKLAKGTVLSIGPDVEDITVGSTVMYDQWSVYYDTHPIVITRAENIIVEVEEE